MRRRRRYAELLRVESADPLAAVANLFDVAMVFAVALLVAFAAHAAPRAPVDPDDAMETLVETGRPAQGDGQRIGVAWRLPDGRVVCVPE